MEAGIDMKMEMLASLPCYPLYAPLAYLADDLGLDSQAEVRDVLNQLKKDRYNLGFGNKVYRTRKNGKEQSGRCVWIYGSSWTKAKMVAGRYFDKMYPASRQHVNNIRITPRH